MTNFFTWMFLVNNLTISNFFTGSIVANHLSLIPSSHCPMLAPEATYERKIFSSSGTSSVVLRISCFRMPHLWKSVSISQGFYSSKMHLTQHRQNFQHVALPCESKIYIVLQEGWEAVQLYRVAHFKQEHFRHTKPILQTNYNKFINQIQIHVDSTGKNRVNRPLNRSWGGGGGGGVTSHSTARVILGKVLSTVTCGTRTHTEMTA